MSVFLMKMRCVPDTTSNAAFGGVSFFWRPTNTLAQPPSALTISVALGAPDGGDGSRSRFFAGDLSPGTLRIFDFSFAPPDFVGFDSLSLDSSGVSEPVDPPDPPDCAGVAEPVDPPD